MTKFLRAFFVLYSFRISSVLLFLRRSIPQRGSEGILHARVSLKWVSFRIFYFNFYRYQWAGSYFPMSSTLSFHILLQNEMPYCLLSNSTFNLINLNMICSNWFLWLVARFKILFVIIEMYTDMLDVNEDVFRFLVK